MSNLLTILTLLLVFILTFFLVLLFIFWVFQFSYSLDKNKIGYLPTNSKKVLNRLSKIFKQFEIEQKDYDFVELGCGTANISGWVSQNHDFKKIIGVEMDFMTIFMAKVLTKLKGQKVDLIRKNVFNYKIEKKSIIYCYLGHHILNNLYKQKKLDGHLVISLTFSLKDKKPDYKENVGLFYQNIYVYDFRD
jgi:hypothetical protein